MSNILAIGGIKDLRGLIFPLRSYECLPVLMLSVSTCICALLLVGFASAAPAASGSASSKPPSSSSSSAASPVATVPFASTNANGPLWNASVVQDPQPIRGSLGATVIGSTGNSELDKQNPDLVAPPGSDHGDV